MRVKALLGLSVAFSLIYLSLPMYDPQKMPQIGISRLLSNESGMTARITSH